MKRIFIISALFYCSTAFSQFTSILLDYDAVDELETTGSGGTYEREFWSLNSNFPDDPTVMGLTWVAVRFDSLYDSDNLVAYSYDDKELTIDSVRVFFTHENASGTPDTIIISIFQYQGVTGLELDSMEQVTNIVLFDTMIITSTSLTSTLFQIESITIYPDLQLATGEKFLAGVRFSGDLSNTFNLITGYSNNCGFVCFEPSASPSVFESNSFYHIIYWDGPVSFTGVNSVEFDCNGNSIPGEPNECELFTIQNIAVQAYVSFADSAVTTRNGIIANAASINFHPNPADDFVTVLMNGFQSQGKLTLSDMQGKTWLEQNFAISGNNMIKLDISNLPGGMYFITAADTRQISTSKLIKR